MCVCVCVCVCGRERERNRETETGRESETVYNTLLRDITSAVPGSFLLCDCVRVCVQVSGSAGENSNQLKKKFILCYPIKDGGGNVTPGSREICFLFRDWSLRAH